MTVTAHAEAVLELDPELAPLVERTRGLQPLRRLFHAGNGLILALVPVRLGLERGATLAILGVVFVALLTGDLVRLRSRRANALFFTLFPALASPREARAAASSTWYVAGAWLAYALFPPEIVAPAILVLALADPAAGTIGRLWGHARLGAGTVVGSAAFLAVAVAVMASAVGLPKGLAAALFVTAIECLPWKLDDNLTIPLAAGAALWLTSA